MVIKKNIALATLGLALSGSALAQAPRPAPVTDERGIYIGAGAGRVDFSDACRNSLAGFSGTCDENDTSYKLFAGYDFSRMFAAEIAYVDLGKAVLNGNVGAAAASGTLEAKGYELSGLIKYPFTNTLTGYGRLGLFMQDVDFRSNVGAVGSSSSSDNVDWTFGLGLRYSFTRNIAVQGEWQRYNDIGTGSAGVGSVDVLGVSVLFKF